MYEFLSLIAIMGLLWGVCVVVDRLLARAVEREKLMLKREQLKDQLFRDACDSVHHLRIENDALTAMVMSMQKDSHHGRS